ncbi:hypothetical protein [Marinimicrobium agarilyticum]|uniref:hypothetical protein n=1 Tax=Marinimicrobium agarilyticum TaxID=306546 RepID=UPI00041A284D|nr:hypothetical protein [Marinimicrobium agarilyticum]
MRLLALLFLIGLALPTLADSDTYPIHYHVTLNPAENRAEVVIETDHGGRLKKLDFDIDSGRYSDFEANGELTVNDERAVWVPPENNARLSYHVSITHERDPGEYDARITEDWAIFRGDDIVPAATVRTQSGARADATLTFTLPEHWTSVRTGWEKLAERRFGIDNPERRFDRPTGWMIAGVLGTRLEQLGNTRLVVSAPVDSSLRRMDAIAITTNVWPEMEKAFGDTPPYILVAGHGDPMWRGALSGPNSLFLHGDRPIVSENGTSTLIHELVHVITRIDGDNHSDWIAEGLAEFYAVELMHRAGAFTDERRDLIMEDLADWGEDVKTLRHAHSSGEITARAVVLFDQLDREIREETDGAYSLDDITRELMEEREVDTEDLRTEVEAILGKASKTLQSPLLVLEGEGD